MNHKTGNKQFVLSNEMTDNKTVAKRLQTEHFIHDCFKKAYDADIKLFMPVLISLTTANGDIKAAFGLRAADTSPLFLETYLQKPIEKLLGNIHTQPVERSEIVELGNLAVAERGGSRPLISTISAFLETTHFEWVVFTIGSSLLNSFNRLGLDLHDLGPARLEHLPYPDQQDWGSYYDHNPHVMAGKISEARTFFSSIDPSSNRHTGKQAA